ncbi:MAG TPA: alpha/beta hydrolase [Bryobacteraceae bacterium]|nr:alpha/beta hydrolase [Bryobacteraceae bacterium]
MLLFLAIPAVLLILGIIYQRIGVSSDLERHPPPGRLIEVDGVSLHIRATGTGRPAVIFESGVAASSVSWTPVQDLIAEFTSTASYDRSGFGWSHQTERPQTAMEMVESLRSLLKTAGFVSPFIFVGHSFGALLVRLYADRWPEEVAGMVLVDPALLLEWADPSPERLRMLGRGIALSRRGALLAKIGFVRLSLSLLTGGSRALPKLFSKLSSGKGHSVSERLVGEVRKLPPALWPVVQSHWCRPQSFESMARHLAALPETAALVYKTNPSRSIPVTVISAGALTQSQLAEHETIARSSDQGRHIVAGRSGHWVHLDEPEIVVEAIRDILSRSGVSRMQEN